MDIESTSHLFPHIPLFDDKRITLPSILSKINCKLIEKNESSLIAVWQFIALFEKSSLILSGYIDYILSSEKLEEPLL